VLCRVAVLSLHTQLYVYTAVSVLYILSMYSQDTHAVCLQLCAAAAAAVDVDVDVAKLIHLTVVLLLHVTASLLLLLQCIAAAGCSLQ
jgi:hypothetical protein